MKTLHFALELREDGYQFALFDGLNNYFVANEQIARAALIFPANVVDNFIHFTDLEREAERKAAVEYAEDLRRTLLLKDGALSEHVRIVAERDASLSEKEKELLALDPIAGEDARKHPLFDTCRPAGFTICSWNYLAYALTLRQSLVETNPEISFYIFIADRPDTDVADELQGEHVIVVDETIAPEFEQMAQLYSIMEYNTSVKPHCFEHLFDKLGHSVVIYLDPDILVLRTLNEIYSELAVEVDCMLTPHITAPLDDGKQPDDLAIARAGIYNLGFLGLANRPESRRFLTWWRGWLDTDCVVDIPRGIFVDQRFCDFAPSFIRRTRIIHDPGYNLAYWNLLHRPVERRDGTLYAGGSPVKFVHFSGFDKDNPNEFSKHQNRFTRATIGELGPVFDNYLKSIRANDRYQGGTFSKIAYGFNRLIDVVPMTDVVRACVHKYKHTIPAGTSVYDLTATFFAEPSTPMRDGEQPISRLLAEIYNSRPDLQNSFDLATAVGRDGLVRWATANVESEVGVPLAWVVQSHNRTPSTARLIRNTKSTRNTKTTKERVKKEMSRLKRQLISLVGEPPIRIPVRKALALRSQQQEPQPARNKRHGLAVYGFLHTETGIGQAGRLLADAFATTGLPQSNHTLTPPGFDNGVEYQVATGLDNDLDHALLAINADNVRNLASYMDPAHIATNRRLGLFFWELPVFPGFWSSALDALDEVWVASSFVRDSLGSATTKPIHVVPLPVPLNNLHSKSSRSALGLPDDRLIYLVTFDFNSYPQRKNPIAAVRAFIDAFPKASTSSPLLVVKCHGIHNRHEHEAALRTAINGHDHVMLIDRVMSKVQMLQLQSACDVHVSLHRSEGFGLNLAEAMAAGKLAIGTNFSGNVDFMTPANSLPIDYKMQQLKENDYVFWHGQWWADPDHDHAVAAMRQAENASLRDKLGARARNDVADTLALDHVGSIMRRLIEEPS